MQFDPIGQNLKISTAAVLNQNNTGLPVAHAGAPSAPVQRQFKYKCEDKAAALLTEEGITDINGKVRPDLISLSKIPLNLEERARVEHCFTVLHDVMDSYDSLKIQISATDVLKDLFGDVFDECELIGSAAFYAMGVSFCKRFAQHLLETALPNNKERVPDILKRLFTPEFEAYLQQKFNKKLADIDARLTSSNRSPNVMHPVTIDRSINKAVTALVKKIPLISIPKENERRAKALAILKEKLPGLDWEWVDIKSPSFYLTVIKALAFNKLAVSTKDGELLGILNIGKPTETTIDFVFALKLARKEIFPSVVIPCRSSLYQETRHQDICPTGDHWVQGMLDKMTGRDRPNVLTATEDDAKMLLVALTKGGVNPIKNSDKILINIARNESLNQYNKTVRKVLKANPELKNKLKEIFPYFFAQLLKEAVDTHLGKDPSAAIAITINAIDMLNGSVTCDEMKVFIKEMQKYWAGKSGSNLIYHLANILGETYELDNHNDLAHRLSIIKLCAFLRCQASNDNKSEMVVYPRHNGGVPSLEIIVKGDERDYSLMLKLGNTSHVLRDAIKYINLARPDYTTINRLLTVSQTTFQGPMSSPLLSDLDYLGHKSEVFERSSSHLLQHHPLLGALVSFATQTQSNKIVLNDLLVNMPRIIHRMKENQKFIYDNLTVLLATPEQKKTLKILADFMNEKPNATEVDIAEHWIANISEIKEWMPFAHECFVSYLHQNPTLTNEDRSTILFNQINEVLIKDPRFALKLLHFAHQKEYVPFKELIKPYSKVTKAILTKPDLETFAEDVLRLEKIALSLYKNGDFGFEETEHFKKLVKPLVPHSKAIASTLESFNRVSKQNAALRQEVAVETVDFNAELAALAESDYEEAAIVFFRMAKNHRFPRSSTPLLPILHRILQKASQDNNFQLAISLLKQPDLRDFLALRPEKYFEMMLNFSEECQKNNQNELSEVCLISILKTFKPNEQLNPTPTVEILARLVNHVLSSLNETTYSDQSNELARVFLYGFDSLYTSLNAREMSCECVRIYHQAHLLGATRILQKFAGFVIDVITELKPSEADMMKILDQVEEIIPSLAAYAINLKKYNYFEIVVALLIYNQKPEKVRFYLNHLFNIDTLTSKEDLELLYELFEKFKDKNLDEALCLLEAYKGPYLSPSKIEEAKLYIPELHAIAETKDWLHLCQALAVNPFTWNDPIKLDALGALSRQAITGMLTKEKLSLQELKWIFTILNRYKIQDPHLVNNCIERCDGVMDTILANKMWEAFNIHILNAEIDFTLDKSILILLGALKFRDKQRIHSVLDNKNFVNLIASRTTIVYRPNLFRGLMKANQSIIKLAKASEKLELLKQFERRVVSWDSALWPEHHVDRDSAIFDLVEYYVKSTNDQMIPKAAEHLQCVKDNKSERYKDLLTRVIACVPRESTPDIPEDTLIVLLRDAQELNISFILLAKCLSRCKGDRLVAQGLVILNHCCQIPNYPIQEMRQLPNLGVYQFLKKIVDDQSKKLNPFQETRDDNLIRMLKEDKCKLRLFMKQDEFSDMITTFAKNSLTRVVENLESGNPLGKMMVATMVFISYYNDIIFKKDNFTLDLFVDTCMAFLTQSSDLKDFAKILVCGIGDKGGAENVCIYANHLAINLRRTIATVNDKRFLIIEHIQYINSELVRLKNLVPRFPEKTMKELKKWVQWQLTFENKTCKQNAIKFVNELNLAKEHSSDLLEMRIALMIMAKHEVEKCLESCRAQPEILNKIFLSFFNDYTQVLYGCHERFYTECRFALECFRTIPHKDSHATLSLLVQSLFAIISEIKNAEEECKILIPLWVNACEDSPRLITDVLKVYIQGNPESSFKMLKEKVAALQHFATQKKIVPDLFSDNAVKGIYEFLRLLLEDPLKNEKVILGVFELYQQFVFGISKVYNKPEDLLIACEGYLIMIRHLLTALKSQCVIKSKTTINSLLMDLEIHKQRIPKVLPQELSHRLIPINVDGPKLNQKDIQDIFAKYKKTLRE